MSASESVWTEVRLPDALLTDFKWAQPLKDSAGVLMRIPDEYSELLRAAPAASEVLGIQRLITISRQAPIRASWSAGMIESVLAAPFEFPLLSVLLLLRSVEHRLVGVPEHQVLNVENVRTAILKHRLIRSTSVRNDVALCMEGEANSLSHDLYNSGTLKLYPREHFETLAVEALSTQLKAGAAAREVYQNAALLGTILSELIENSDMHGRRDATGRPVIHGGVRGLVFRRVTLTLPVSMPLKDQPKTREVDCFEASVFDSGIGYFQSFTREALTGETDLEFEWKVLHNCLERHYHPNVPDTRPAHRGLGLYEVLRALQALKGRIEFRTGRLFAYRTFLDGELQAQMKPRAPFAHLAWPEPRLLDVQKKYFARPTAQEPLIGSSVRILVPLN